jgi:SAM-dependent methyltransferase
VAHGAGACHARSRWYTIVMARPVEPEARRARNARITEFFDAWTVYKKAVDHDYLGHRATYAALRAFLEERFAGRPFSVLDLGCGDASFIAAALRGTTASAYTGLDLSATALELARRNLAGVIDEPRLEKVDLLDGLRAATTTFDVVSSSYALHHLSLAEKSAFLGHCRRALAPGGVVAIIDVMRGEAESRDAYIERFTADLARRADAYSPGELEALLGHIRANDFPESLATYARLAGDNGMRVVQAIPVAEYFGFVACAA